MKKLLLSIMMGSLIITVAPAQSYRSSFKHTKPAKIYNGYGVNKTKNWSIGYNSGWQIEGPGKNAEKTMEQNRFSVDNNSTNRYPPIYHVLKGMTTFMLSLKYDLESETGLPFSVGIVGGRINLGSSEAYYHHDFDGYFYNNNLNLRYSAYNICPLFSYNIVNILSIGIGPSVYFTEIKQTDTYDQMSDPDSKQTKLGFLTDLELRVPGSNSPVFFKINAQYRYVGKVEIGPYCSDPEGYAFPKTKVSFNHGFVGAGVGVRL